MRNVLKYFPLFTLFYFFATGAFSADKFSIIKNKIDSAAVVHLNVLITIESKVFNDIDSAFGEIILAEDGRYRAEINSDIYLNDGKHYWEYSAENNQATRRIIKEGEVSDNRLAFFKDIDSFYKTSIVKQDIIYRLIKLDSADEALTDCLTVFLKENGLQISKIEYYDLNDDLNCIYIMEESHEDRIKKELFELSLPDSAEIISLP